MEGWALDPGMVGGAPTQGKRAEMNPLTSSSDPSVEGLWAKLAEIEAKYEAQLKECAAEIKALKSASGGIEDRSDVTDKPAPGTWGEPFDYALETAQLETGYASTELPAGLWSAALIAPLSARSRSR